MPVHSSLRQKMGLLPCVIVLFLYPPHLSYSSLIEIRINGSIFFWSLGSKKLKTPSFVRIEEERRERGHLPRGRLPGDKWQPWYFSSPRGRLAARGPPRAARWDDRRSAGEAPILTARQKSWFQSDVDWFSNSDLCSFNNCSSEQRYCLSFSSSVCLESNNNKKQPKVDEDWDANWTPTWNTSISQKPSSCLNNNNKKHSQSPIPLLLTLQLDLSPVSVANLGWLGGGERSWREPKRRRGGGDCTSSGKNFSPHEVCRSKRRSREAGGSPPGLLLLLLLRRRLWEWRGVRYMCPGLER